MQITNTITNINTIINYLQSLPLKQDPSSYSKGRLLCWINKEPLLYIKRDCLKLSKPSYKDSLIPSLCEGLLNFKVDYILVTYSGNNANGINWHRDSTYAAPIAATINLGPCKFGLVNTNKEEQWLDMKGGEVITFNCKQLHCAIPSPNRWAIHCWQNSGK
jgi:hypothetical protein